MNKGIVIGKFMPLHKGHLGLIEFARKQADHLSIILCYTNEEPIDGATRTKWLYSCFGNCNDVSIIPYSYNEKDLPNTSVSSREVSQKWAAVLKDLVPDATHIFSSEPYGDYVAEFMNIDHVMYDQARADHPVSGSSIRKDPFLYWDLIAPPAREYFLFKVVVLGTESTGKSTLVERLANHYKTGFVPEMAREIIEKTEECRYDHLVAIANLHATTILQKIPSGNKLIFADTDLNITKSYSTFLFKRNLVVDDWVEKANHFNLYLFLEPDCEYVQDGTRLSEIERNRLSQHHKETLQDAGVSFVSIGGDWEERFQQAIVIIDRILFQ